MKRIFLFVAIMAICGNVFAQNSAITRAKLLMEKGETNEAATLLEEALKNPKTTKFAEMYNMAAELNAQIFNPQLLNAAKGLPFDTVLFGNALDKSITYYIASHKADVTPDAKGRVKSKFIAQNHDRLKDMLDYYNYAAMFMNQMGDKNRSMEFFKKYLELPNCGVFSDAEKDSILNAKKVAYTQTAQNLAILNYQDKNMDEALLYATSALKSGEPSRDLYIISMQAHLAKNDSTAWLDCLKEAVNKTGDVNFMQNLLFHYVNKNDVDAATTMAQDMITSAPDNKASWYIKGCVDLNMKKDYKAAREAFAKSLEIDPEFPDANINMAYAYMNEVRARLMAGEFKYVNTSSASITGKEAVETYKKELAEVQQYYKDALPYMEKVSQLLPDTPKTWAYALQMIYDNLQMKEKKAEIDAIIESF